MKHHSLTVGFVLCSFCQLVAQHDASPKRYVIVRDACFVIIFHLFVKTHYFLEPEVGKLRCYGEELFFYCPLVNAG